MASSERVEHLRRGKIITGIISAILMVAPVSFYTLKYMITGELVKHKVTIAVTVFIVMVMTVISLMNKFTFRSKIWIIMIGLYVALGNIITPMIVIGSCQIVDEIIVTPLHRYYAKHYGLAREMSYGRE